MIEQNGKSPSIKFRDYNQCPSCGVVFRFSTNITVGLRDETKPIDPEGWHQYRDEIEQQVSERLPCITSLMDLNTTPKQELVKSSLSDDFLDTNCGRTKTFACPACGKGLQFVFALVPLMVIEVDDAVKIKTPFVKVKKTILTPDQQQLIDQAKNSGLLEKFTDALLEAIPSGTPRDVDKHFLDSISVARPIGLPYQILERLSKILETKKDRITAYATHYVVFILDGELLRYFVPLPLIKNQNAEKRSMKIGSANLISDRIGATEWFNNGKGYVPTGGNLFFEELKNQSKYKVVDL